MKSVLSKHTWSNVVLDCRKLFIAQGSYAGDCVKCLLIKRNHVVSLFLLPMQSINTEQIVLNAFLELHSYSFNTNILYHRQRQQAEDGKKSKTRRKNTIQLMRLRQVTLSLCFLSFCAANNWYLSNVVRRFFFGAMTSLGDVDSVIFTQNINLGKNRQRTYIDLKFLKFYNFSKQHPFCCDALCRIYLYFLPLDRIQSARISVMIMGATSKTLFRHKS